MMVRTRRLALPILTASALGIFPACSSSSSTGDSGGSSAPAITSSATCPSPEAGSGTPVGATERNSSIELDTHSLKAGSTTFSVDNAGPSTHQFVVLATDLAPDSLPVSEGFGNPVDEKGKGVTLIDKIKDISVGCSASLTLDLDSGNYVVICNLPGHYASGMYAPLKVT
ncbi:MAG: hypothetical protein H0W82_08075 [Actinobacteria bacterium]|nr:hypothetical protein [Actinomycetota bacterium]